MKKTHKQKPTGREAAAGMQKHGIRSIAVGVSILKVLATFRRPATLGEIARAAGMTPTRTHRYLVGLVRCGMIEQNPLTARYDLGAELVGLGVTAIGRIDAVRLANEAVTGLTERTQLPSLVAVWGTNGPTVIRSEQPDLSSPVRIREGRNLPLARSATGKVFLAYHPVSAVKPMLDRELKAWNKAHPQNVITPQGVEALRAEVRRQGLARAAGEENPNLSALSAPVFDRNGRLALSLTLIGIAATFDDSLNGEPARILRKESRSLSRRLGAPVEDGGTAAGA